MSLSFKSLFLFFANGVFLEIVCWKWFLSQYFPDVSMLDAKISRAKSEEILGRRPDRPGVDTSFISVSCRECRIFMDTFPPTKSRENLWIILLMEEILYQLIGIDRYSSLSPLFPGFYTSQVVIAGFLPSTVLQPHGRWSIGSVKIDIQRLKYHPRFLQGLCGQSSLEICGSLSWFIILTMFIASG